MEEGGWKRALDTHAGLYGLHTRVIRKTADEIVNNSNTVQNDDELKLTVLANEVWLLTVLMIINSPAANDIKTAWTIPAGASMLKARNDQEIIAQDATAVVSTGTDGNNQTYIFYLIYVGGANAGTIQLQWAQNTAGAVDTTVLKNSCIIATKVG